MQFIENITEDYLKVNNEIVRTKFSKESEVNEWVSELMSISKVTWSITRTIRTPQCKARKNTFKRMYHCHFNTIHRPLQGPRKRNHATRNTSCPAMLTVTFAYLPKFKSRSKTPDDLAKDWPCIIKFSGQHNHSVFGADALTQRPISESTKKEILKYFERGHSVASAYHSFCFEKMEEYGDKYNMLSADRHFFPNKADFRHLWLKYFKDTDGGKTSSDLFNRLHDNLLNNEGVLFKIGHIDDYYAISLCTPMMKRATELLKQASDVLFVDDIGDCDAQCRTIYFFAIQSAAGSIPLSCIISTSQIDELFDLAVKNLLDINLQKISPKIILAGDDRSKRKVLQKYWPNSKILLRTFDVLKSVWKWLNMDGNKIPKDDRQFHYKLFKNVLYAQTKEELDTSIATFQSNCKFKNYEKYVYQKVEKNIHDWCLYYRKEFLTEGSNTNNIMEVKFRLIKDIPLERTKAYDLVQVTDFVTSDFEGYYKQRLLDLCFSTDAKGTINRFCPNTKDVFFSQIKHIKDMEFCVLGSEMEEKYFVDLSIGVCNCLEGFTGKMCKHQLSVILNLNSESTLTDENKTVFCEVSTGLEAPEGYLAPLEKPEVSESSDEHKHSFPEINENHGLSDTTSVCGDTDISTIKTMWSDFITSFSESVITGLEDDPQRFIPAIQSCIASYQRYVTSSSRLVSSLSTLFKSNNNRYARQRLFTNAVKGVKKGRVELKSIAKRKSLAAGRRKMQAGRHAASLKKIK